MNHEDASFTAYQKSHYHEDRRSGIIISNSLLLVVAYIAILLKFTARRLAHTPFLGDDYWNWASLLIFTIYICGDFTLVHYGLGLHIVRVTSIKGFIITSTVGACLYNLNILAIKLSFLYFYRRLFPQYWFKIALIATGTLVISSTIAFLFLDILQCIPLASQWDTSIRGTCIDFTAVVLAAGVINVVTDFTILILPMPVLYNLKVSPARKRMIMCTFTLGGLVCGVSTVRCFFLSSFKGTDVSWGDIDTVELSTVELGVGILSACLPAYRPLYNHIVHGRATAYVSNPRSRFHGPSSGGSNGVIKLASLRKKDGRHNSQTQDDDDEQALNPERNIANAQDKKQDPYRPYVRDGKSIAVTAHSAPFPSVVPPCERWRS